MILDEIVQAARTSSAQSREEYVREWVTYLADLDPVAFPMARTNRVFTYPENPRVGEPIELLLTVAYYSVPANPVSREPGEGRVGWALCRQGEAPDLTIGARKAASRLIQVYPKNLLIHGVEPLHCPLPEWKAHFVADKIWFTVLMEEPRISLVPEEVDQLVAATKTRLRSPLFESPGKKLSRIDAEIERLKKRLEELLNEHIEVTTKAVEAQFKELKRQKHVGSGS